MFEKHSWKQVEEEEGNIHSVIFPMGVVHRVENGWGLTKVAAVLLNALIWQKMIYILKLHIYADILSCGAKKN